MYKYSNSQNLEEKYLVESSEIASKVVSQVGYHGVYTISVKNTAKLFEAELT
jgi:hypothetical protein